MTIMIATQEKDGFYCNQHPKAMFLQLSSYKYLGVYINMWTIFFIDMLTWHD
jgi:hypothetical protein